MGVTFCLVFWSLLTWVAAGLGLALRLRVLRVCLLPFMVGWDLVKVRWVFKGFFLFFLEREVGVMRVRALVWYWLGVGLEGKWSV